MELPGATFTMGTDAPGYPADGEGPARDVELSAFAVDRCAVTNADFARFVDATGYLTESEQLNWSFVFGGLLPDDFPPTRGVAAAPWWRQVEGAHWRHPDGPQSDLVGREDQPVVHVSWNDAMAYCGWADVRLPTEAEWEYAARGGLEGKVFPWGDELEPSGQQRMNVWQGEFPNNNTVADGFYGLAPVRSFPANGFGLFEMTGNTWEWCADWFHPSHHRDLDGIQRDPTGPASGETRVMKGGSFLCHHSYCHRYRPAARSANTPDSAAGNIGFRTVTDLSPKSR